MALKKSIETKTGAIGEYIKVLRVEADCSETPSKLYFQVGLYKDKASRDAGKNAMEIYSFHTNFSDENTGMRTLLYNYLKSLPEFAGAEDC